MVEDTYGIEFFKKLINRLKIEDLIPTEVRIDADRAPAACNKKLDRILTTTFKFSTRDFVKAIVIHDGDGNPENKRRILLNHVPRDLRDRVELLIFEDEIEEWICKSLEYRLRGLKPSVALSRNLERDQGRRYEKRNLPEFVDQLNFDILNNDDERFKKLIIFLRN
ncbi:MAG: hypothetical protein ACTSRW_08680 [Candidatus Helarchaeota archaeon]